MVAEQSSTESIGQNVRGLLTHAERLARAEMELAVAKGKDVLGDQARHVTMLMGAALLGLGGIAYLLYAVFAALRERVDPWAAALITALVAFAAAGMFVKLAVKRDVTSDVSGASLERAVSAR